MGVAVLGGGAGVERHLHAGIDKLTFVPIALGLRAY